MASAILTAGSHLLHIVHADDVRAVEDGGGHGCRVARGQGGGELLAGEGGGAAASRG